MTLWYKVCDHCGELIKNNDSGGHYKVNCVWRADYEGDEL